MPGSSFARALVRRVAPAAVLAAGVAACGSHAAPDAGATATTASRPGTTAPAAPASAAAHLLPGGLYGYVGHGPKVVLIGDSLAHGAEADTLPRLAGLAVAWNAYPGTTWPDWTARADSVRSMDPAVVVAELGTNDLWDGWQEHDRADLDAFLAAVGPVPCLVLVNYASHGHVVDITDSPNPAYEPAEVTADRVLPEVAAARTAARQPTVVADWRRHAAGHASWFGWDGVHYTPAGNRAWAAWLSGAIRRITSTGHCTAP